LLIDFCIAMAGIGATGTAGGGMVLSRTDFNAAGNCMKY
jgi:hypothetical protein